MNVAAQSARVARYDDVRERFAMYDRHAMRTRHTTDMPCVKLYDRHDMSATQIHIMSGGSSQHLRSAR